MTEPSVFDRGEALRRLLKNEKLLREVIGIFLRDLPRLRANLTAAVDIDSPTALRLAAHSLRGAASQVGGEKVAGLAFQIEQHVTAEKLPAAIAIMPSLTRELDELTLALEGELAKGSA